MAKKDQNMKKIGDTTSVTIPAFYRDFLTKEERPITSKHLRLINDAFKNREFVHLVMSGIDRILAHEPPSQEVTEDEKMVVDRMLDYLEKRLVNVAFQGNLSSIVQAESGHEVDDSSSEEEDEGFGELLAQYTT